MRVSHWVVVAAFFVAYFTEDDFLTVHVWAGYTVGILLIARVAWGFVGPKHARFASFIYPPAEVFRYLAALFRRTAARYLGHSPAGGAMVILLLISLAGTVWSGLSVYAYDQGAGPQARVLTTQPTADGDAPLARQQGAAPSALEAKEDFWEELHELFANLTLTLVAVHIAGVLLASFVHRENLPWAMVSGKKRE